MKSPGGKKPRGLHRGFDHLHSVDDFVKTSNVIDKITGRTRSQEGAQNDFERRFAKYFPAEGDAMPSAGMLLKSIALEDRVTAGDLDLSLRFPGLTESYLQLPNFYADEIAPMLHPYADIIYRKAWRESYGRNRRVFFRAGIQYLIKGTSLKSRAAVETGKMELLQRRLLIRVTNDNEPHKGSLFRVVSPIEVKDGLLLEGLPLQSIPFEGLPRKNIPADL